MDETEWLRSADAGRLLDYLYPTRGLHSTPPQPRKLRLYLVALGRLVGRRMPPACRAALDLAERVADAAVGADVRDAGRDAAERMTRAHGDPAEADRVADLFRGLGADVPAGPAAKLPPAEWARLTWLAFLPLWTDLPPYKWVPAHLHRADLVRDVFGNPFRPPDLDPGWRSAAAVGLAASMYERRDFSPLPALADALEEAGCQVPAVLDHCRDPDLPHARGCWLADFLLGRG